MINFDEEFEEEIGTCGWEGRGQIINNNNNDLDYVFFK